MLSIHFGNLCRMEQTIASPLFLPLIGIFVLKISMLLLVNLKMSLMQELQPKFNKPISIVICARNESANLMKFLPLIMVQDYPDFEVVIVNDRSLDDTADTLRVFEQKHSNLKVTVIQENDKFNFNKKFALTIGIKATSYDYILFTDADCKPVSNQWLKNMVAPFQDKSIVVGYGGYSAETGIVNKMIRAETHLIAQHYFGIGKLGIPYMAVGRNMAYNKNLFFEGKGFSNHQHINSGDDDLFMNENANQTNTAFIFDSNSYTQSIPKKTWAEYLEQKRRHLTTGVRYKLTTQVLLSLITLVNLTFYLFAGFCLFIGSVNLAALIALILVFVVIMAISYKGLKTSKSLDLLPWIFICDIFIILFYPFALCYNYLQSGSLWKNY